MIGETLHTSPEKSLTFDILITIKSLIVVGFDIGCHEAIITF